MAHAAPSVQLITFVSTLISYALAGASAFSNILHVAPEAIILPFVLICVGIIVFLSGIVQPILSALTSVKVVLLVFIIGAVGLVSEQVSIKPGNVRTGRGFAHCAAGHSLPSRCQHFRYNQNWVTIMQPFLIGTVAIGGIADTMPVLISGAELTRRASILHFRWSVSAGVCACYILNLLWGLFVLRIVPQTEADAVRRGWSEDQSLEWAASHGQIATIPVTAVIDTYFPTYSWVARLVTIFIVLSICVSFNAIGLALKHALDGLAVSLLQVRPPGSCSPLLHCRPQRNPAPGCSSLRPTSVSLPRRALRFSTCFLLTPMPLPLTLRMALLSAPASLRGFLPLAMCAQPVHIFRQACTSCGTPAASSSCCLGGVPSTWSTLE